MTKLSPLNNICLVRIFFCRFFVELYAESWLVIHIGIPVLDGRNSGEHFMYWFTEPGPFLNAKIRSGKTHMHLRRMTHRIHIRRTMPGCPNTENLAEMSNLHCLGKTTDHAEMNADEIHHALGNQRLPFQRVCAKLSVRNGSCAKVFYISIIFVLIGRKQILQEEKPIGLQGFRKIDGITCGYPLMHIMYKFRHITKSIPRVANIPITSPT